MPVNSAKPASGCLILFAIPFIGMGLFFAVVSYRNMGNPSFHNPGIGIVVGTIFALFGALIMAAGFGVVRGQKKALAIQAAHPAEPWMWREDWAQGRAAGQSSKSTATSWAFAAIWNGISWVSVWAAFQKPIPAGRSWVYLILAIFPTVGLGLLSWAILQTLRRMRFGKTTLQLQTLPAVLGRNLKGTIEVRLPYPLPHGINLALTCINRVTSGGGDHQSTFDHIRWQEKKTLGPEQIMAGPMGSTIPVEFDVPRDMPSSDNRDPSSLILWMVRAEADIPGVNFDESYEVPVFETRESPSLQEWQAKEEMQERTHPPSAPVRPTVVISSAPEGGTQFYFPAGRNVSSALGVTLFALIFGGVTVGIVYAHAPLLFPIVFGFFSFLLLVIALNLWFGSARIVANSSGLALHTNLLGYHGSKQWTSAQIQDVYPKITMQSGSVPYYTVTIRFDGASQYSMGNALRDHNEAEWVCAQIRQCANLATKSVATQ